MIPEHVSRTPEGLERWVVEEHERLRLAVVGLKTELAGASLTPGSHLAGKMRSFADHLRKHFRDEEAGGLLHDENGMHRESQGLVVRLRAQHRSMEERMARLIDRAERAEAATEVVTGSFLREARDLLEDLSEHERIERRLVRDLAYEELHGSE